MDTTPPDRLIVEGLVITAAADGSPHLAPMGPLVERDLRTFTLRPFCTSQTFANMQRTGVAVFHLTDDVELLARGAIGKIEAMPPVVPIASPPGYALADCCRWFALRVNAAEVAPPRATFQCEVVESGRVRDWFGFNRAKHAVVEAAILATRIGILPDEEISAEITRLTPLVQKTAGEQERRAWQLLTEHIEERLGG
ncbi:DUF447 domain-containing protein [Anatilimnocola sp. NA78]|uniref:DUF447 domain-containing protein n=1 Tax=Anatilimnocola sp. NA78 TaxID=3415683 RepID=UPI003CE5A7B3